MGPIRRAGVGSFFSEIANIRDKHPALQEKLAPGKVLMPWPGLLPPGFGAFIVQPEGPEGEPRRTTNPWLMRIPVNDEAVDSLAKRGIYQGLESKRMILPFCVLGV